MKMQIPKPSEAEKWISPDVFQYQGKQYEVDIRGNVALLEKCKVHGTNYPRDTECPDCMKENDAAQDAKREEQGLPFTTLKYQSTLSKLVIVLE